MCVCVYAVRKCTHTHTHVIRTLFSLIRRSPPTSPHAFPHIEHSVRPHKTHGHALELASVAHAHTHVYIGKEVICPLSGMENLGGIYANLCPPQPHIILVITETRLRTYYTLNRIRKPLTTTRNARTGRRFATRCDERHDMLPKGDVRADPIRGVGVCDCVETCVNIFLCAVCVSVTACVHVAPGFRQSARHA